MAVHVVLLRGINVGGANKLPMADLRAICGDLGAEDVSTYIQSGNAVMRSDHSATGLEAALEAALRESAGLDLSVMVRSAADFRAVVESGVYADEADGTKRIVSFLTSRPSASVRAALDDIDQESFSPEAFTLRGREIFFHLPDGQGRAKLPEAVTRVMKGGPTATARNWKTVERLHAMADALVAG